MSSEISVDGSHAMAVAEDSEIDEGLYSRQLYVMGYEAQKRMASSNVLILGLGGLGVEVAKNIILAGVKSVTLWDPTPASLTDLSAQFYLTEKDVGRSRAEASAHQLAQLNQYVPVTVESGPLTANFVKRFQVVCSTDLSLHDQLRLNEITHSNGISFIGSEIRGVFGYVFCDFGPKFVVFDPTDEPAASFMIGAITQGNPGVVTVVEDGRHGLETGNVVAISEVEGMTEVNGREFSVRVTGPSTFEIDADTSGFQPYLRGGYINEIKQPATHSFRPLKEALVDPKGEFVLADYAKMDGPPVLHLAFRALHELRSRKGGELPGAGSTQDADELLSIAKAINAEASEGAKVDAEVFEKQSGLIRRLALCARGVLNPMASFFGGIVGQEVLKASSGKFTPIKQWFYFDAVEALPSDPLPPDEVAPVGSRYDGQIAVFGKTLQAALSDQACFLVGAGAIGCEMLKNWACMGVGAGAKGAIHVTDMDRIEKSNLSRQFLFRSDDIGGAKSVVAARAAATMNSSLKVCAYENRVGADTEHIFNDDFYESLTGVCTALDNVEARLYMDQRCLFYQLPMLESGTLGTKGNTQIVVPHLTENYGATRDPPEKSIPVCTLKNFPNQIEHTVQWGRDWFEGVFKQAPEDVNQYLTNPEFIPHLRTQQNTKLETVKRIYESLLTNRPSSFEDCATWARLRFEELFNNIIRQLLHNFPIDQVTSTGTPFWSGPKKPPTPLAFDVEDPVHLEFVKSVANLRASIYGITGRTDDRFYKEYLPDVMVPDFSPQEGVKIATTDAEQKQQEQNGGAVGNNSLDIDAQFELLVRALPPPESLSGTKLTAVDFDKDVDDHMLVVSATSNLRARNYKIPEENLHRTRQIAGKIIPAIATTTALVTGLVCLELYKLVQKKPLESYRNAFVNLALPLFTFSEPQPPAQQKAVVKGEEWKWSAWDRIDVEGNLTLREFLKYVEDHFGLSVSMVSHGVSILHSFLSSKKTIEQRMPMRLSEVVQTVTKKPLPDAKKFLILEIICSDKDTQEDVEVPYVRLRIK